MGRVHPTRWIFFEPTVCQFPPLYTAHSPYFSSASIHVLYWQHPDYLYGITLDNSYILVGIAQYRKMELPHIPTIKYISKAYKWNGGHLVSANRKRRKYISCAYARCMRINTYFWAIVSILYDWIAYMASGSVNEAFIALNILLSILWQSKLIYVF